jgi:hypothetical protein
MIEALRSSEMAALTRATRLTSKKDGILHSDRRENFQILYKLISIEFVPAHVRMRANITTLRNAAVTSRFIFQSDRRLWKMNVVVCNGKEEETIAWNAALSVTGTAEPVGRM